MTYLKQLARKKGMDYKRIASDLQISQDQVRQSATTEKRHFSRIKSYLEGYENVDPSIIYQAVGALDISMSELSRKIGLHDQHCSKILSGNFVMYRDIEARIKDLL